MKTHLKFVPARSRQYTSRGVTDICQCNLVKIHMNSSGLPQVYCFLVLFATSLVGGDSKNVVKRGIFGEHWEPHHRPVDEVKYEDHVKATVITKEVKYRVPQPYPVTVEKKVPYVVKVPVEVEIKKPYPVEVPKPYAVYIEKKVPFTVEKKVPYPVEVKVKVPVPVPHHVHVPKPYPVPVHVPKPYPVKVPVYVEKKVPIYVKEHEHEGGHHHHF